ncbi:hypothetical protein ACLB2K_010712 [Fragaria x ananassa]
MATDLLLRPSCRGCGSTSELYGSNCKHTTLCVSCGKSMAEDKAKCSDCGAILTRLIREYSVWVNTVDEKEYFIGKFSTGLPKFLEKKSCENKWSLCKKKTKGGLQGRQDSFQDKLLRNKPWVLEDETGHTLYQSDPELSAAYYLLMRKGNKEISAIPAGSWFNFKKVAQYKQFTLEEAEDRMSSRKKKQDGHERWILKAATNGAVAYGNVVKFGDNDSKYKIGDDDEGVSGNDDFDDDDDDSEKGDDWEHDEIFSDDEENTLEEIEDFATEVPAPTKFKQDGDEDYNNDEDGRLSKSGKELKKLLGCLNESDTEDDDANGDEDMDDVIDNGPSKLVPSGTSQTTPSTSKRKRKGNTDESKAYLHKKAKTENNQNLSVNEEPASAGPVTQEEIRAVLMQQSPITMRDLLNNFAGRLRSKEEKEAFTAILKDMRSQKTISRRSKDDGTGCFVVLREKMN